MVKHRGVLTILGAAALSAVSLAVGLQVHAWLYRLPDPATADREGLARWLVIADLTEHDDATCRALVDRFETLFADDETDVDFGGDSSSLSAAERDRVARNAERLKEIWFCSRVDGYCALGHSERDAYMDRQIRNIFRCAGIDRQFHEAQSESRNLGSGEGSNFVGDFFASISEWQASAPVAKREQMAKVVRTGLIRWLATYDLGAYSPAARHEIVASLEKELGENLSFGNPGAALMGKELVQFWRNVEVLAETWFHAKSAQFAALSPAERRQFVARQLKVIDELAAHWPSSSQGGAAEIAVKLQSWITSTDERHRQAAREFAGALQGAWIARLFGGAS